MSNTYRVMRGCYPSHKRPLSETQRARDFDAALAFHGAVQDVIWDWSQEANLVSGGPGFAVRHAVEAYEKALANLGAEFTISPVEPYEEPDTDCEFNCRLSVVVRTSTWAHKANVYLHVDCGTLYCDDDESKPADLIEAFHTDIGTDALDANARQQMRKFFEEAAAYTAHRLAEAA